MNSVKRIDNGFLSNIDNSLKYLTYPYI